MKKRIRTLTFMLLSILAAGGARAGDGALSLVPKDTEVVVGINARQIVDADLFAKAAALIPQINAGAAVIENMTGVNVLKDIDHVVAFGNIADRNTGGVIVEGRINPQKLRTLLQSAPQYQTTQTEGRTVHEWFDVHEQRRKYGMLLDNGNIAMWNSLAAMQASLGVLKDGANSFAASPDARLIPEEAGETALWMVLVNRQNKGPAAKYRIATILYRLTLGPAELTSALTVIPQNAEDTAKWVEMGRGLIAFGQLQGNPKLSYLASHSKAEASGDGKSMTWLTAVENDKLLAALGKK